MEILDFIRGVNLGILGLDKHPATGGSEEAVRRMIGEVTEDKDGSLTYSGTISRIIKKAGFAQKMIV